MLRKLMFMFIGISTGSLVGFALSLLTNSLLLRRRLPEQSHVSMDGITTLDEAVEVCRGTHLHGWELVAYASLWWQENLPTRG